MRVLLNSGAITGKRLLLRMQVTVLTIRAFTANSHGGNPAGVVLQADGLSGQAMQRIAAQAGFSEVAFVYPSSRASYAVRFFTPKTEVNLCGHATIAAWSLMYERGLVKPGSYTQETAAGILGIRVADDGVVFMQQARAEFFAEIPSPQLAPLLGISEADFHSGLKPQIVSTGLKDVLIPVRDETVLARVQPDLDAIAQFSTARECSGFHVFALLDGADSFTSARNFAPADGIPEESATGTSSGAMLCYLKNHRVLPDRDIYRLEQGRSMGALSYIYGRFEHETVWIGGHATITGERKVPAEA